MTVTRKSGCKINLILNILGKRADGFHELETLMLPVPIHDLLTFSTTGNSIELTCNKPDLPTGADNLIWSAANAFFKNTNIESGVSIHLEKNIPTAAGLGGGSGNAANTLLALNELFDSPLSFSQMSGICSKLGSDIPFFLQDKPALAFGRGETIEPLETATLLSGKWLLLVNPGFGISTPWAYQNLARFPDHLNGQPERARRLANQLESARTPLAELDLYNSLEAPALDKYPILSILQESLLRHHAVVAMMSGSGATTFGIFNNEAHVASAKEAIHSEFGDSFWTAVSAL
ncbi:4-(cytidine 5'-diphospho)-2-C-methyl-D-erythritol kinase [Verrucomicrobia bacterium]|nr:4-(cytidine 5'-diphospho)-2-C-methyl-D-erythritol kinase [Verrucomicrobiota bacterium]